MPVISFFYSYLALDDNKFSGPLPSWMGTELLNLEYLILGRNKFEGNLPVEWGKFPKMINIQAQQNYHSKRMGKYYNFDWIVPW